MSITEGPVAIVILPSYIGGKIVAVPFCDSLENWNDEQILGVSGRPEGGGDTFPAIRQGARHTRLEGVRIKARVSVANGVVGC
jgi:hypothetical protein